MSRFHLNKIMLISYAFIAGAIFGWGFAFLIITPIIQLLMAKITASDRGVLWMNYFSYAMFVISIVGGIYISEKWCLDYLKKNIKL